MSYARLVQALLALAAIATFLPWSKAGGSSDAGVQGGSGQLAMLACIVGIILIHLKFRPAWMAAGLAVAIGARELSGLADGTSAGIGLWLTLVLALAAAAMLIYKMFADLDSSHPAS